MGRFKIIAVNDEYDFCTCCGRQGLKRVVMMQQLDADGNVEVYAEPFGTSCAAKLLGYRNPSSSITKRKIEEIATAEMKAAKIERHRQIMRDAIVTGHAYDVNKFGVPVFIACVNGENIKIEGNHIINREMCSIESLYIACKNIYANMHWK